MDPYDVLGLKPTNDWKSIRAAYKKMLVATHPDRMNGDAKYFMMVHEAYNVLDKSRAASKRESKAPITKPQYSTESHDQSQTHIELSKDMSSNQFNNFFEQQRINSLDPFTRGYGDRMSKRSNMREDDSSLMRNKVNIPKRDVVIYKEPSAISNGWTDSYAQLGVENIDDFSTTGATDYMKAYSQPEEMIDTTQKFASREELEKARESANFQMTQQERAYQEQKQRDEIRLEEYRRRSYNTDLDNMTQQFTRLNNRLSWRG